MSRVRQSEVLISNEAFYTAFTTRDLQAMDMLWATEIDVSCIHPGATPIYGREAVMESWTQILSGPVKTALECLEPKAHFLGEDLAMVICFERLGAEILVATNIFARNGVDWMMVHHQSGPLATEIVRTPDMPSPRLLQ